MAEYQLTAPEEPCVIIRIEDGANIPPAPGNRDYDEYVLWKEAGNTPDPYVEPPPPPPAPPTPEQEVLFDHENRVRTLEGQPPLTMEDFRNAKSI